MQGSTDRPRRDDFHSVTFSGPAPARAPTRTRVPPSRLRYHAKWIAINLAILAASAYVYRYHLIPRFIQPGMDEKAWSTGARDGGDTDGDRGAQGTVRADAVLDQRRIQAEEAGLRLQRAEAAHDEGDTTTVGYLSESMAARLGLRCIGGRAYRIRKTEPVTTIEQLNTFCTPD